MRRGTYGNAETNKQRVDKKLINEQYEHDNTVTKNTIAKIRLMIASRNVRST